MKKRYTEGQIIGFLREADAGLPVNELCRKHGFSEPIYYAWKVKFDCMNVSDAQRLKALKVENTKLKKLLVSLDARDQRDEQGTQGKVAPVSNCCCGARIRNRRPCKSKVLYRVGRRCTLHEGFSTGPKTKKGKAASRRNGKKVGAPERTVKLNASPVLKTQPHESPSKPDISTQGKFCRFGQLEPTTSWLAALPDTPSSSLTGRRFELGLT